MIAQAIFQTKECLPAGSSKVLDAVLSRKWTDYHGANVRATISGLSDPKNGVRRLDNDDVEAELKADRAPLYCNTPHAMAQVGMMFRKDRVGNLLTVDEVTVADPWPGNGFRALSAEEMSPAGSMTYLAAVEVRN